MDVEPSSFRDAAAFIFKKDGMLLRCIKNSYKEHYDYFMSSGLYDALVQEKMIIAHQEIVDVFIDTNQYKIIQPEYVPFISYPYEWCFDQLKDAALLVVRIQEVALQHGMTLKDASAFNVQFHKGGPLWIDTTSFIKYEAGKPWIAYQQFCQFFIAPLALMSNVDVRLNRLLQNYIDGIPIELASRLLPWQSWLTVRYFLHIHLHARMPNDGMRGDGSHSFFRGRYLQHLTHHLHAFIKSIRPPCRSSRWPDYYAEIDVEKTVYLRYKEQVISHWLKGTHAKTVWDFGANTGYFSTIAAGLGMHVLAFDSDHDVVSAIYTDLAIKKEFRILPLLFDLAQPSPAIGFANKERSTIEERGSPDIILCLGLTHHLYFNNCIPFDKIAGLFASMKAVLIIEFIPLDDPSLRETTAHVPQKKEGYSQSIFEKSFSKLFTIKDRIHVSGSQRILYLMACTEYVH